MKAIQKNVLREISKTKSRFFSILAIIAISTGFFTGVKSSSPSMIETGLEYFVDQNLMDIRLLSTVGFDDDDINAIKSMDSTVDVMPGYFSDLIVTENNIDSVVRVFSIPKKTKTNNKIINEPDLIKGRMPQKSGECVIEEYYYKVTDTNIGDIIHFNKNDGDRKTTDTIRNLDYKIVGVVSTPVYITYRRGNTNKGSASISYYIMIPPDEFVSERYTDVYLTTTAGDLNVSPYSSEYKELIDKQLKEYEKLGNKRIELFNSTTLTDAKNKYSDAEDEFNKQKKDAEKELSDGEKKIYEGEKELNKKLIEGENKLNDAEKEIEKGKKELEKAQADYTKGIEEAKLKLTDAEKQYADGKQQYTDSKHTYDVEMEKAQSELDDARKEFDTQYSLFYGTTKPQAETKLTLLKTGIDFCNQTIEKTEKKINELEAIVNPDGIISEKLEELNNTLKEYQDKLDEYNKQYEEGEKQLSDGEAKLAEAKQKLSEAQTEFQTKKIEASDQLNDAQIQLDQAQSQLEIGKLEYNTALTTGAMQIQSAQSKLSDSEQKLKDGRQELEKQKAAGHLMLKESREKLINGKTEANTKLADAEKKLRDAQKQIDSLNDAKWLLYNRDDNIDYSNLEEDAIRVDNIATVFPVFFLLVAALVCLTTMSRMVEERRTEIGTLKALGYSNIRIAAKYFIYAALAAIIGSIVGAIAGVATIPYIIVHTYSILYTLPDTILVISWESFLFSAGTGVLCTCTVAVITCFSELKINPATLMRPKAPKPGKRILLEYITPVWSRMKFTSKVTARNIFRYKARFLMTVIGVAGCTALMIGGFGLKDSIGIVAGRQFDELTIYDQIFAFSKEGTAKEKEFIMSKFHADSHFTEAMLVSQLWANVDYGDRKHIEFRTIIGENKDQFKKMFILRDRETHEKVELSDNGVVINERLSEVIGKYPGDTITFTINDNEYSCKITGLTENYAGNYMYLTPEFYEKLTGKEIEYNVVFTKLTDESVPHSHEIANEWMKDDDIVTVFLIKDQVEAVTSTLDSLNVIVFVLIFCAGMLAMVVLYNLTNINISERVREIATIKVLGFYDLETANYIYRENIILTLVGAFAGMPLGHVFTSFVIKEIQMDIVMFPQYIEPISFVYGFILTLLFSFVVNFIMYFKMNKISMVESLKSIE